MNVGTSIEPGKMKLSLQMLADHMEDKLWDFVPSFNGDKPLLRGCALYCGQQVFQDDMVYLLPEGTTDFPTGRYRYITTDNIKGAAPHIRCVNHPLPVILNLVMEVFQSYRDFELRLCAIATGGGSLHDLCAVGSEFFKNPMYIHDDMFAVLAYSRRFEGMMKFEYNERTGKIHIPLWLIDDFKFDKSYQDTLEKQSAAIWGTEHYPNATRSLYVNLWDGSHYRGRLLVNEIASSLQPGQFRAAEYLAQYAVMILRRDDQYHVHPYRSFEDTFVELIQTGTADHLDIRMMLDILDWDGTDPYLCIKLRSQNPSNAIRSDSALGSQLASTLHSYYSFYHDKCLFIVVNLPRSGQSSNTIRQLLAPHIRDSYMYGGISNPVSGIYQIGHGFRQTEIILDYITNTNSSKWLLPFSACALNHIRAEAVRTMPPELLACPELLRLRHMDRENGTEYYETLKAYLTCERNIPQAAEALIIHRTTLTYRLGKIKQLLNLNLDDKTQRLYLLLSFSLLEDQ